MFAWLTVDLLLYIAIPISSALVGWGTNVLALKMMFYPLEFFGWKKIYLGWQGIIPSKAEKMAVTAVDLMTSKLINVEEVFSHIDSKRVAAEMGPAVDRMVRQIISEVMEEDSPKVWESIPLRVKDHIFNKAAAEFPQIIDDMMVDIRMNISTLFDIKKMVVEELLRDKELLNQIFLQCGEEEFKFIARSGIYFGFLFGLVQMSIWIFYKPWWLLPLAGLIVGYATNWLALKLVFEPMHPKKIGPFVVQGMFLKRQNEVASEYAKLVASKILNSQNIIEHIILGPASDKLEGILQLHLKRAIDEMAGISKPFLQVMIGTQKFIELKHVLCDRLIENMSRPVTHILSYTEEAMDIEHEIRDKMRSLPTEEFQDLLRPIFQEDELKLIIVGAILGCMVGFAQLVFLFS
ncbi:MAG: uncharacterized membrane protein YheB (UPF0754 family) [bacterium]|jgi:uncharacterized membrane protein YheB (UPF0754 family)